VPKDADSDFVFSNPSAPDQEITIPNSQAGTYYVLARTTNDTNASASKAFTLLAAGVTFGVDGVEPPVVGAGEEVTLRVTGGDLDSASRIYLRPTGGGTDITPIKTTLADAAHARLRFNLLGAPLGAYDIISESPSSQRVLTRAVTLEPPNEIAVELEVIPPAGMKRTHGTIQGVTQFILRNNTNVDVPFVRFDVFSPADPNLSLYLDGEVPEPFTTTAEYEEGRFLISSLGPGEEVMVPILIDLQWGYQNGSIALFPSALALNREQVLEGILLREGGWFDWYVDLLRQQASWTPEAEEGIPYFRDALREAFLLYGFDVPDGLRVARGQTLPPTTKWWCRTLCILPAAVCFVPACFASPLCGALCVIATGAGTMMCLDAAARLCPECLRERICDLEVDCGTCSGGTSARCCLRMCSWELRPVHPGSKELVCELVCKGGFWVLYDCSFDPNEKVGPGGFGAERFVDARATLTYRVYFENVGRGPAAEVIVTDTLDFALDITSFRPRQFRFGSTTVDVPEGRSAYETILDFTQEMNLLVELKAAIDPPTHKATFTLRALDPETRQLPSELDRGFLPQNDDTGRGEGYVEFSMKPLVSAVHTGTVIKNKAPIRFDYNDPVCACAPGQPRDWDRDLGCLCEGWLNTIDAGAPSSSVASLPTESLTPFVLRWSGQDDAGGSGIGNYAVSVKTDNGAFVPWRSSTGTWGYFAGEAGKTYAFYTVATDNVGNVEATPSQPDSTTRVSGRWVDCLAGPGAQPPPGCGAADLDRDSDVDLKDFAALQLGVVPAPPP